MRHLSIRLALTLALLVVVAAVPVLGQGQERYMVEFHRFGPDSVKAVRAAGGTPVHEFPQYGVVAAWLPDAALKGLANNPNVRQIAKDQKRYLLSETVPYGIPMVQADQVADPSSPACKVCIIDSGYYVNHEDLQSANVTGYTDSMSQVRLLPSAAIPRVWSARSGMAQLHFTSSRFSATTARGRTRPI